MAAYSPLTHTRPARTRRRSTGTTTTTTTLASCTTLLVAAITLALLSLAATPAAALGVISFDYGADSLKTALIKPGMPPDVVLTRDSKRKLPAVVAWNRDDRAFGTPAMGLATRFPGDTFPDLKLLLGRTPADDVITARYADLLGSTIVPVPERNTLALQRATDYTRNKAGADTHTVEEVVAMLFSHAKMLAEETAGEKVRVSYPGAIGTFGGLDTVVTVPTFWTAQERQAIYDAATLAGFRPRIVSDAAAAATSLALNRNFPNKPELHLLYDAGHSATRASLVRFSTRAFPTDDLFGTTFKDHTFIEVLSTGWSRHAGGLALDEALRDILLSKTQDPDLVASNQRAMAKLLASATKTKHILSANSEARVSIEGLVGDVDFRTTVTRDEFEQAVTARGLDAEFGAPVHDALARAGAHLADVDSVILIGGTSRVPLVHSALASAGVPTSLLAQNLNADEAMALGAGFYGASFSPQLKMKPIRVADVSPYAIELREPGSDVPSETLFPGSPATFETVSHLLAYDGAVDDFSFEVAYSHDAAPLLHASGFERDLYRFDVSGVDASLAELKAAGDLAKVDTSVNLTLVSDPLGTVSVESAWLNVKPKKDGGLVGALKGFFGGASTSAKSSATDANATDATSNGTDADADGGNATATDTPAADLVHDRAIRLTAKSASLHAVQPLSASAHTSSKNKLYHADAAARQKLQREEVRNRLESYAYRLRELGAGAAEDPHFAAASTPAERAAIASASAETSEWLSSDAGDAAGLEDLRARLATLEALVRPVEARVAEARGRAGAEKRLAAALQSARVFLEEANANLTAAIERGAASTYARTDLDALQAQVGADATWFDGVQREQRGRALEEEPAWRVEDAEKRARRVSDKVGKLRRKRVPKTRPVGAGAKKGGEGKGSKEGDNKAQKTEKGEKEQRHEEL